MKAMPPLPPNQIVSCIILIQISILVTDCLYNAAQRGGFLFRSTFTSHLGHVLSQVSPLFAFLIQFMACLFLHKNANFVSVAQFQSLSLTNKFFGSNAKVSRRTADSHSFLKTAKSFIWGISSIPVPLVLSSAGSIST
jgi:hypothetical protein